MRAAQYHLFGRAQGRHRHRDLRPQMGITPLLTRGAQFDGTKFTWLGSVTNEVSTCVSWHTVAGQDLEGRADEVDHLRRRRPGRRSATCSRCSTRTCSTPRSSWSPAITARRRSSSRWSAARSTACAAIRGAPQEQAPGLAQGEEDQHPHPGRVARRNPTCRTCRWRSTSPRPRSSARSFKVSSQPGNGAPVRRAARHSRRSGRRPVRRSRQMLKDPEFLAETKKLNLDVNPHQWRRTFDQHAGRTLRAPPKNDP